MPLRAIVISLLLALAGLVPAFADAPAPPAAPVLAPVVLTPGDRAAVIDILVAAPADGLPGLTRPVAQAADDAALRAAALAYAKAQYGGRLNPRGLNNDWALNPRTPDLAAGYAAAAGVGGAGAWLRASAPADPRYAALLAQRHAYQAWAAAGPWPEAPAPPKPVRAKAAKATDPRAAILRARLRAEGYALPVLPDEAVWDGALTTAIGLFQVRHGLPVDGLAGAATTAALNVSATERLAQIDANLERWRWLPRALPAERVEVNVAAQDLALFVGGAPGLSMRVIVGSPAHHTPLFASAISSVVFNPPWVVPASIAIKELYPKERAHPGYLARSRISLIDGQLVQEPGPKNSLGVIKFDFDSPFGVYLHDTNAPGLFASASRAFSHGCVRLEKPRELAAWLLGREGWTAERIEAAIAAGKTRRVTLSHTTPLFVVYWTVSVGGDGAALFTSDIYGWDPMLTRALAATS